MKFLSLSFFSLHFVFFFSSSSFSLAGIFFSLFFPFFLSPPPLAPTLSSFLSSLLSTFLRHAFHAHHGPVDSTGMHTLSHMIGAAPSPSHAALANSNSNSTHNHHGHGPGQAWGAGAGADGNGNGKAEPVQTARKKPQLTAEQKKLQERRAKQQQVGNFCSSCCYCVFLFLLLLLLLLLLLCCHFCFCYCFVVLLLCYMIEKALYHGCCCI